jgi:hypothetical protein
MKLKYNRTSELGIVGIGVFKPNQIIEINNELKAEKYLETGYFDEIEEIKEKEKKIKIRKFKKERSDYNANWE